MVVVTFASPTADEDGMLPSQENPYGQYSYVDNAPTFSANKRTSNSPSFLAGPDLNQGRTKLIGTHQVKLVKFCHILTLTQMGPIWRTT
jgi:hypothetical protein